MISSPLTSYPGDIKPSISSLSYGPCFKPDVYLMSGFLIFALIDSTSLYVLKKTDLINPLSIAL